jgi:hypothetical protein
LSEKAVGAFEPYRFVGNIDNRIASLLLLTVEGVEHVPFDECEEITKPQQYYRKLGSCGVALLEVAAWIWAVNNTRIESDLRGNWW